MRTTPSGAVPVRRKEGSQQVGPRPHEAIVPGPRALAILQAVADEWDVTVPDITGPDRTMYLSRVRSAAVVALRDGTKFSLPHIGRVLGGRDHTTILHHLRAYEKRMAEGHA